MRQKRLSTFLISKRAVGLYYEQNARAYLENQGLVFIEAGFFCRVGEIDLVMREGNELVFVEVRMRNSGVNFQSPLESVGYRKLLKLRRAIEFYLLKKETLIQNLSPSCIRLDILGYDGTEWTWVKNQG